MATRTRTTKKNRIDASKSEVLDKMKEWTRTYLAREPVIGMEELDNLMTRQFQDYANEFAKPMQGKQRSEFLNLVDWVKADLTEQRIWFRVCGDIFVYLPTIGYVNEIDLVEKQAARLALRSLGNKLEAATR